MQRWLIAFVLAAFGSVAIAQAPPPPPPGDFPKPAHPEGRKKKNKKDVLDPENKGVKPPHPITPPTPEGSRPEDPE